MCSFPKTVATRFESHDCIECLCSRTISLNWNVFVPNLLQQDDASVQVSSIKPWHVEELKCPDLNPTP